MGFDIYSNLRKARKAFRYVQQDDFLFDDLTVEQNIEFHSIIQGITHDNLTEMHSFLPFEDIQKIKVSRLSGGQKRILSIALALLVNPSLLILDEPTANLDLVSRHAVWNAIFKIKSKVTLVIAT